MAPPKNPVATSDNDAGTNTLKVGFVRLPLGHSAEDKDAQHDKTLFWLVIPTDTGGRLVLVHKGKGGAITLLAHDGQTVVAPKATSGIIDIALQPGTYGNFYVLAEGGDVREVSSQFIQTGIAREAKSETAPPLIPWNFYFWPGARTFDDGSPNPQIPVIDKMIQRYAYAFGKDQKAAVLWEKTYQYPFGRLRPRSRWTPT
jgi:hypothetical protein